MPEKYKRISMYCCEKKRSVCKTFTRAKFKDEAELNKAIEQCRTLQKLKNKNFKVMKQQQKNSMVTMAINKMTGNIKPMTIMNSIPEIKIDSKIENIPNTKIDDPEDEVKDHIMSVYNKLPIQNTFNLVISPNTGNTTFLFGSSKRGKSTLMMHIYDRYYNTNSFVSTLFSINDQLDMYKGRPLLLRCPAFNKKAQKYIKLEKFINNKCANKYKWCNLIDDVIDVRHSKVLNNMVLTYRNSMLSTVMNLQYARLLSKQARCNVNNIILFGYNTDEGIADTVKVFVKSYFKKMGLTNETDMIELYKLLTNNHGFIYIQPMTDQISFHKIRL